MSDDPFAARLAELNALMDRSMSRLEAAYASFDPEALARLEAGQTKLRTDFLDELGKTRADVMGKVTELQGDVKQIRDDISVNQGAVDMARQVNDNTRDDLKQMREQLSVMYRRMLKIEAEIRELKGEP